MKKINMADPYFDDEDREIIHREIESILDYSLSMGPNVKAFEDEFVSKLDVKHAIAMNSCTSALEAGLSYYNVQGREVIIPSETFIATGMAVHLSGGIPVFAEISKETFCLDLNDVVQRVSDKTAGIILVHMGGLITKDIEDFRSFCDSNNLFLIEDAAHSPGAKIDDKQAGTFGHLGCFSFFPTKVITSGEGGMLTTNDDAIAKYTRSFQNRGRDMDATKEIYINPGRNVRMTEMSALLGRIQFSKLDSFLEKRREIAKIYINHLKGLSGLKIVHPEKLEQSSFWKMPVLLDQNIDRQSVIKQMASKNITVDTAYDPPLHLQPVIKEIYGLHNVNIPKTENYLKRHICLPCHPRMTDEDAHLVVDTLKRIISLG